VNANEQQNYYQKTLTRTILLEGRSVKRIPPQTTLTFDFYFWPWPSKM